MKISIRNEQDKLKITKEIRDVVKEAVKKSLPEYFDLMKSLGANFTVYKN